MTRYLHTHDPDVTDEHYAELVDADRDHYPTRAEMAQDEAEEHP